MKISADTENELNEAISAHAAQGWIVETTGTTVSGEHFAYLKREELKEKIFQCNVCKKTNKDATLLCNKPVHLRTCENAIALLRIDIIEK